MASSQTSAREFEQNLKRLTKKEIDDAIDSGDIEAVYEDVGCKNPNHNPEDVKYDIPSKPNALIKEKRKCDGCHLLKFKTKSYAGENVIPANPNSELFSERNFSTVELKEFKQREPHCLAKDYISSRTEFYKNVKSVF